MLQRLTLGPASSLLFPSSPSSPALSSMTRTKQLRDKVRAKRQQQRAADNAATAAMQPATNYNYNTQPPTHLTTPHSHMHPHTHSHAYPPHPHSHSAAGSLSHDSHDYHHSHAMLPSVHESQQPAAASLAVPATQPTSTALTLEESDIKMFFDGARLGLLDHLASLLDTGHITSAHIDQAFLIAAEHGHQRLLSLLLPKVSSLVARTPRGDTALHLSAAHGHYDIVDLLCKVSTGTAIEERNNAGQTPLYVAVDNNQAHVVALLLEKGGVVNAADTAHNSILHVAAANGYAPIVLMVLKAGAVLTGMNDKDETALEVSKNSEICRLLLEFTTVTLTLDPPSPTAAALSSHPATSPHILSPHLPTPISPFRELPSGPSSYLFWTAMGVGKDSYMFQNFGVFPFDRLNDTERIIVLTEVAEAMSGYKTDLKGSLLNESALYAVFALMKARIKRELEDGELLEADEQESVVWRKRVLEAYQQVYGVEAAVCGLSLDCFKRTVWNTVVNLLARSLFGESFWEKKRMFLSPNGFERMSLLRHYRVDPHYFHCRLPNTASVEIQLTFKKLITMSKTFLCDDSERSSSRPPSAGCFCQECIAELEVPLTFKLQFLEEAAAEKRKLKKGRKGNGSGGGGQLTLPPGNGTANSNSTALTVAGKTNHKSASTALTSSHSTHSAIFPHSSSSSSPTTSAVSPASSPTALDTTRSKLDDLIITQRKELSNFFCFPTADHEILTDRGFLSHAAVRSLLASRVTVRVACPVMRRPGEYALQYHTVGLSELIEAESERLVEFRCEANDVDLLVTDNHRMLVRLGKADAMVEQPWTVPYVRADEVAASKEEAVQLLCHASYGVSHVSAEHRRLPCSETLGLNSVDEEDAFLKLYGRWHACGRVLQKKNRGSRSVCVPVRSQADGEEVEAVLHRLPLTRGNTWHRVYRQAGCSTRATCDMRDDESSEEEMEDDSCSSAGTGQHSIVISHPRWVSYFAASRPWRHVNAPSPQRRPASRTTTRRASLSARSTDESDGSQSSEEDSEHDNAPKQDERQNGGLAQWASCQCLEARQVRQLIRGLSSAIGSPVDKHRTSLLVCSAQQAEDYQHLCLQAGYTAVCERVMAKGLNRWAVRFTTADAVARPVLTINPATSRQQQHVRSLPTSSATPVWCVSVPTPEHLLIVRRKYHSPTCVTATLHSSRPVIVGNSSISVEEKWVLTEMSTAELSEIISQASEWETLRAALASYAQYAWEEDVLEISDDCVTIADDMCEDGKGMSDMLEAMLDAVETIKADELGPLPHHSAHSGSIATTALVSSHGSHHPHQHHSHHHPHPSASSPLSDEEWDKRGRQMLENCVLAEFARKVAAQYLLKKQESKAQQVALELELELLQEEMAVKKGKAGEKKKKKKAAKRKDKGAGGVGAARLAEEAEGEVEEEKEEEKVDTAIELKEEKREETKQQETSRPPAATEEKDDEKDTEQKLEDERDTEKEQRVEAVREEPKRGGSKEKEKKKKQRQNSTVTTLDRMLSSSSSSSSNANKSKPASASSTSSTSASPASSLPVSAVPSPTSSSATASKGKEVIKASPQVAAAVLNNPFAMLDDQAAKKRAQLAATAPPAAQQPALTAALSMAKRQSSETEEADTLAIAADDSTDALVDGLLLVITKDSYLSFLHSHQVGLSRQQFPIVRHLKPLRTAVLLFNASDRTVHGVYQCTGLVGENVNPAGFTGARVKAGVGKSGGGGGIGGVGYSSWMELRSVDGMEVEVSESVVRGLFGSEGLKARKVDLKLVKDVTAASKVQAGKRKEQSVRQPVTTQRPPGTPAVTAAITAKPVISVAATQPRAQPQPQQKQSSKQATPPTASTAPVATTAAPQPKATSAAASPLVSTGAVNTDAAKSAAAGLVKNVWKLRQEQKASEQQPSPPAVSATASAVGSPVSAAVTPPIGSPLAIALSGGGVIINPTITIIPSSLQGSSWQSSAQRAAAVSNIAPASAAAPSYSPGQSWSAVAGARVATAGGGAETASAPASPPLTTVRTLSPIVPIATVVNTSAMTSAPDFDIGQPVPAWLPPVTHQPPPQLLVDDIAHSHQQQQQQQWMDEHHQQLMHGGHTAPASHTHPSSPLSSRSYESAFESSSHDHLPISAADAYVRTPPISPLRAVGSLASAASFAPPMPLSAAPVPQLHMQSYSIHSGMASHPHQHAMPPSPSNRSLLNTGMPPLHPSMIVGRPAPPPALMFAPMTGYGRTPSPHPPFPPQQPMYHPPPPALSHAALPYSLPMPYQPPPHAMYDEQRRQFEVEEERRYEAAEVIRQQQHQQEERERDMMREREREMAIAVKYEEEISRGMDGLQLHMYQPSAHMQLQHSPPALPPPHISHPHQLHSLAHFRPSPPSLDVQHDELDVRQMELEMQRRDEAAAAAVNAMRLTHAHFSPSPSPSSAGSSNSKSTLSSLWGNSTASTLSSSTWGSTVWSATSASHAHPSSMLNGGGSGGGGREDKLDPWQLKDEPLSGGIAGGWTSKPASLSLSDYTGSSVSSSGKSTPSLLSSLPSIPNSYGSNFAGSSIWGATGDVGGSGSGAGSGGSVNGVQTFAAPGPLLVSPKSAVGGGGGGLKGKAVGGFSGDSLWSSNTQSGW